MFVYVSDSKQETPLLTEIEVAKRLNISPFTLRNWRQQEKGPPYIKVGDSVRYQPADLEAWIRDNRKVW